jgi:3-hydroxybutyryl-CoA dehydratase
MKEGDDLPTVERLIEQDLIEAYAEASGDFNPIHVDHEYAAGSQFGGTIAHGMMIAASISEMMTLAFPEQWPTSGRLKIRFRAPVRPGDTVTTFGQVKKIKGQEYGRQITCSVGVRGRDGEAAITGDATVTVPAAA